MRIGLREGNTPSIVYSGPFYLMRDIPEANKDTGAANLVDKVRKSYAKMLAKKESKKNELSCFLHYLTDVNIPVGMSDTSSTLQSLLETRIVINREIPPLNAVQYIGFRLLQGQLPPKYRIFNQILHKKHKKHKKKQRSQNPDSHAIGDGSGPSEIIDPNLAERKKKEKKKEKKKDKKDKKEKKRKTQM